jgi:replicative DNA helicase
MFRGLLGLLGRLGRLGVGALLVTVLLAVPAAWAADSGPAVIPSEDVRREVREALNKIAQFGVEKRNEAVATAREALAKTDMTIEQVEERADRNWDKMDAAARKRARENLKALHKERTELAEWYGGLKHSSAQAWEEIKKGFAKSYSKLEKSLEKVADKF